MDDQEQFTISLPPFQKSVGAQRVRGLVLVGSNQPITAALLIATLAPERVAFLLTTATQAMPDQVAALLHCTQDGWVCPEGDYTSVTNVYQGLRNVLLLWSDLPRPEIAVDVTAGMKQMSIGLAQAAHLERLTTVYVKSEYDRVANRVKPGSQEFEIIPDPYTVFGDLEAAEARRLYAAHEYLGAQRIFSELAQHVKPEDGGDSYGACACIASAYAAWDVFNLPTAQQQLAALLASTLPPSLAPFGATLKTQHAALMRLSSAGANLHDRHGPSLAVLENQQTVRALLGSLHTNAVRRQAQGRYDVAALLRYRCLEVMSQHRLAQHGILSERPDFTSTLQYVPDLEQRYRRVTRAQGRKKFYGLPDRAFGLFVGYMLLAALDDALVRGYTIKHIEDRTEARNKSILAHGYQLITAQEYTLFCRVVEDMLDRFFTISSGDRVAWEHTYTFVQPFAEAQP